MYFVVITPSGSILKTHLTDQNQNQRENVEVRRLAPQNYASEIQMNGDISTEIPGLVSVTPMQAPPRLKPRPPAPLSNMFEEAVPSSAGPVNSFINSISHKVCSFKFFPWICT